MISSIRIGRIVRTSGSPSGHPHRIVTVARVTLDELRAGLRLAEEDVPVVARLATLAPTGRASLPRRDAAPALLERLAVRADDATEILAHWPDETWPEEL